jgi:diaminopimelate decarboxylase
MNSFDDNFNPYYIINLNILIDAYNNWIQLLPLVKPFYAVKCNPDPVIINLLTELGANFDCASKNEIEMISDKSKIIYANPCKIPTHLIYAKENNVDLLTFDCEEELYKITKYHPHTKLILRLAVDDSHSICKFNKKFGCKLDNVTNLLNIALFLNLNIVGFSFHVGSNCQSSKVYYDALNECKKAYDMALNLNININIIDIGGGFSYNDNFINYANYINLGISDFFSNIEIQFIAEPGRYFVEKTHTLYLTIIGKKKIINDNQINFIYYVNDSIYGSFNCIMYDYANPILKPVNNNKTELYMSKFFGITCDSLDLIKDNVLFQELFVEDKIYVSNFGAYTVSASNFNGIDKPINKYKKLNKYI